MRRLILLLALVMPWSVKRWLLNKGLGYSIHRKARIGFSWVDVDLLVMHEGSRIGRFNVVRKLRCVELKSHSNIGQWNFITCFRSSRSAAFSQLRDRDPSLYLGSHSSITMRHLIDCNQTVRIGDFATIAGYGSQLLTHSIDIYSNCQMAHPIEVGDYTFVGTGCILLGGSSLPSFSVLGAGAVLRDSFTEQYCLYAGIPARKVKSIDKSAPYFSRTTGHVL